MSWIPVIFIGVLCIFVGLTLWIFITALLCKIGGIDEPIVGDVEDPQVTSPAVFIFCLLGLVASIAFARFAFLSIASYFGIL